MLGDRLGVNLPHERDYSTVAGFALSVLKHLPETGETFRHDGWKFEVVDMDGRKIDKLIASRPRKTPGTRRRPKRSARACRTSARSRPCRCGRDSCLLDDAIASEAAAERAELLVEAVDFGRGQVCDLLEPIEAEPV